LLIFYCPKSRLVVEVDGGQHYSAEGKEKDRMRDDYMTRVGITVLRFSDREVLENVYAVLEKIWSEL
jgi:very-short-patch-repair endonuclease